MDDLYAFLGQIKSNAYEQDEVLLSYALDSWLKKQPPSSTEGMADLELILKQQHKLIKSNIVRKQVDECISFVDNWFRKWNGRK